MSGKVDRVTQRQDPGPGGQRAGAVDGRLGGAVGGYADFDHGDSLLSIGTARERGGRWTSGSSTRSIPSS